MKKDIQIPEVSNVYMAVVKEYNEEFQCEDWNAYIINNKDVELEMVIIVSKGFDEEKGIETSLFRHKIDNLPANSFAKVELLQEDVIKLSNAFNVTFFENSKMFDKKYLFKKGTIKESGVVTFTRTQNLRPFVTKQIS
ncbi:hypothetical protein [Lutibacter sp. B1]|uniref:hypothetical protein n=1 Tax=Lutibacter sp. B1 TaxID=2725996 RepID=UPI0014577BC8|nr:hypothetical protein [Lutibacter sp. B1]NLP57183.1 hypothetical protein [Lutibacter sp. B1]